MIKLTNISKYYHNEGTVTLALHKINLNFNLGEFVAITGESGSGKSTLLNVIAGIDSYEEGELYINNEETSYYDDQEWESYRRDKIAFIFQNYNLIDSYTVLKNVETALVLQGLSRAERLEKSKEIIKRVGLEQHMKHRASKLSGGQKQRLAIARALAKDVDIIVADEPTGNLDSQSGKQVLELLKEVSSNKLVFLVTHNYDQASEYVSRKIRLFDGEVVEDRVLKHTEIVDSPVRTDKTISEFKKALTITRFNIFGQPKKSIFMFFVTLAIVAFVFLIYTSLNPKAIVNSYPVWSDGINIYTERVIVKRQDEKVMDESDYNFFENYSHISRIIKADHVVDYYMTLDDFENKLNFNGQYSPFLKDSKSKLYGQLPVNDFEVLLSMFVSDYDEEVVLDIIGKEYTFSVKEKTGFSAPIKLTVTGVIHSDTYVGGYYVNDSTFDRMNLVPPTTLDNNQLDISFNDVMISYYPDQIFSSRDLIGNQANIYYSNISENATIILDGVELEVVPNVYNKFYNNAVIISEELFIEKYQRDNYQYTLHINDINKINEVEKHLFNNGYYTFVPSIDLKNNMDLGYIGGVIEYVSMTLIMIFMIFVLYLMGYLIIRIVLNTRIKDYTILRIIGARKSLVSNLIRFELLIFFLISYAVAFGVYFAIQSNIANILPFSFSDFLAVLFINILMSLFISRKFISKRMSSTLYSDLRVE